MTEPLDAKPMLDELSVQRGMLGDRAAHFASQVSALMKENAGLKEELAKLKGETV